jgi:hypothetical protein
MFLRGSAKIPPWLTTDLYEILTHDKRDLATITCSVPIDRNDEPRPSQLSRSTRWRHARGGATGSDKAARQQYLTPCEEKAVVEYVLCMCEREFPLPVKFFGSIAHIIKRQHSSAF